MEEYVIGNERVRFLYLRDEKNFPRICIARILSEDKTAFSVAYTIYNKNDKFDKKVARDTAFDRLKNSDFLRFPVINNDLTDLVEALLANLAFADLKSISNEKEMASIRLVQKLAKRRLKEYRDRKDVRTGYSISLPKVFKKEEPESFAALAAQVFNKI